MGGPADLAEAGATGHPNPAAQPPPVAATEEAGAGGLQTIRLRDKDHLKFVSQAGVPVARILFALCKPSASS